ncbi:MAG: hypothetical protein ACUVQZ_08780 [Candidatus Caldatribacteriaceae bacterium]
MKKDGDGLSLCPKCGVLVLGETVGLWFCFSCGEIFFPLDILEE